MRDRLILGAVSGLLCMVPLKLLNAYEYRRGFTDETYTQSGASLLLPKGVVHSNSTKSKLVGSMVHNTMTAFTGSLIAYLLSATGRDGAILKGAGFAAVDFLATWGVAERLGLKTRSKEPMTYILSFADHLLFGAGTALLITRLGDKSLFPGSEIGQGGRLPIIATGVDNRNL